MGTTKQLVSVSELPQESKEEASEVPTHQSLKLCLLGKTLSGKKTYASSLAEKLGGENMMIFDIN